MLVAIHKCNLLPAEILTPLFELASSKGVEISPLLDKVKINPNILAENNSVISEEKILNLSMLISKEIRDDSIGLLIGKNSYKAIYAITGDLFPTGISLRSSVEKILRYKEMIIPSVSFSVAEENGFVSLKFDFDIEAPGGTEGELSKLNQARYLFYKPSIEIFSSGLWSICSKVLGSDAKYIELHLKYNEPSYRNKYDEVFECAIKFNQSDNALIVSKALFDREMPSAIPAYNRNIQRDLEKKLNKFRKSQSVSDRSREYVNLYAPDSTMSLENLAESLHMTTRTLQRSLKLQSTSFVELRDEERSFLAKNYLENTKLSVEEISCLVGFTDTSGFYLAFRRWFGVSPQNYRKL